MCFPETILATLKFALMSMQTILDLLSAEFSLSPDFTKAISIHLKEHHLQKGQPLRLPSPSGNVMFVQTGLLKACYFSRNGREYITRFWQQGEIIIFKPSPYEPMLPAEYLITLEHTTLFTLSDKHAGFLLERFPQTYPLLNHFQRKEAATSDLISHLRQLPLEQAYKTFVKHFPAHRIPVKDIACFLGVAAKRVSEIRGQKRT